MLEQEHVPAVPDCGHPPRVDLARPELSVGAEWNPHLVAEVPTMSGQERGGRDHPAVAQPDGQPVFDRS
jgi:hypothetical protein